MTASFVSPDVVRSMVSAAISDLFTAEVPRARALRQIVGDINGEVLAKDPAFERRLRRAGELDRLGVVRHAAIRVGTAAELAVLRRLFAVMGLAPVGYYDLSAAGLPVHSTAFRPVARESLRQDPFRVFTSLLRLDLIEDALLRREAAAILARRKIVTPRGLDLIGRFEENGGLDAHEARGFVVEAVETFRWHRAATVPAEVHAGFREAHPLVADVVCFETPHINHLTLRTLDIDAAQAAMRAGGLNPKAIIEGPPRRACPILLRQTSFAAVEEPVDFQGGDGAGRTGVHAARFGEIEQRGQALTAKGRALHDRLLGAARAAREGSNAVAYVQELERQFEAFPDDHATLRTRGLGFFSYAPTAEGLSRAGSPALPRTIEDLLRAGHVACEPIVYEDFLPVSAAGIFRSNLGGEGRGNFAAGASKAAFEAALGAEVQDELTLYAEAETRSRAACLEALGLGPAADGPAPAS